MLNSDNWQNASADIVWPSEQPGVKKFALFKDGMLSPRQNTHYCQDSK